MAFSTNLRSNWTKVTKAGCHKAACHVLTGDVSCQCQVCEHFLGMAPRDLQFVIPMYFKFDTHIYKTKIDLYVSTLWISDHHAPPNLKQYIAQGQRILQQAWMCVLHHKTTKLRSNASVHLCPASFCKFFKPFLRFIFWITRYFHYCSTVLSIYAPLHAVHLYC